MQKQQTSHSFCQVCRQQIPKANFPIHQLRCKLKNQQKLRPVSSRITRSSRNKRIIEKKIQQKVQLEEQRIPCSFCGYMQTFSQLDTHPQKCPGMGQKCEYCGQFYPSELLSEHQNLCQCNQDLLSSSQEESSQLQHPVERLRNLFQLINQLGVLMRGFEQGQEGLPKQKIQKLQKFKYKQNKQQQLCTICYCKFQGNQQCIKLNCKHIYHNQCISKWFQKSSKCPLCKNDQNLGNQDNQQ